MPDPAADSASTLPGLTPGVELLTQLRPYVRHCGDERRPAWRLGRRRLLDYLLVYIAEGRGRFTVGGNEYAAEPGDLFWIPPDTDHEMEGFAPSMVCPYVHFDLVYRPQTSHWDFTIPAGLTDLSELTPLMHPPLADPRLAGLCGQLRTSANRRVGELIREICAEAARGQPFAPLRLSGLMLELLAEILRGLAGAAAETAEHAARLEQAADYLTRHCEEEVPLGQVAELCRLSASRFRELFGRYFGCSPRLYLRRARIRRAKSLLMGSDLNVSEIALRCGFANVHNLSRAFREVEGLSPRQYRRAGPSATRVEGRRTPYPR